MTAPLALLPLFLIACAAGLVVGRRATVDFLPTLGTGIASVILVGALIAAAETGSVAARYLALLAVACASIAGILAFGAGEDWRPDQAEDDAP
ncbi:NAD(P) transhydrogenase subunit alpha [Sphingobium sp. AP50]|uniref:hypothetical protein n=1 Tax=Sphingobium sp. AP50 TaxID=1884369 RepID=UPI0008D1BB30|nr:hypothetical protein [Sphingobium sp. AP50]SEI73341.1 NAD(P) transhydrogenase subunit alpha [Sphingobium sp. AP50]